MYTAVLFQNREKRIFLLIFNIQQTKCMVMLSKEASTMYQNCKNYDPIVRCSCQLRFLDIHYFSKSSNSSLLKGIQQAILVHGQDAQKSFYQNYETHNFRFRYSSGMCQQDFNHQTSPFYHTYNVKYMLLLRVY